MFIDAALKSRLEPSEQKKGDSNLRSILKTISWRILGTVDTILISFLITGSTAMALSIGSIEVITKLVLYYLHERLWSTIKLKSEKV